MNPNLNLLKRAIERIEDNHEFMAYILKKYSEIERISESELISRLECSPDNYYKLALCKAPAMHTEDFHQRLHVIGEYTHIMADKLTMVIKRVQTILKFTTRTENILLAARDKEDGKDQNK